MTKAPFLLIGLLIFCAWPGYAQKGKDGPKIISASNTVVNEYTTLTTDAAAGNTFIKVADTKLNNNGRFAAPLAKGDLLMIIQTQGATINGVPNDSTWGAISNYNNCGLYEFLEVSSVPDAATININCTVKNSYTAAGKVLVVRVPRFSSLTINSGGILTSSLWNGSTGGIVAVEVQNSTTINAGGSIDVSSKGFRGGQLHAVSGGALIQTEFFTTDVNQGGEKGESIAGFETDYNAFGGMFCRGAPANGGGGGNTWNSPGGGGANAGNINAYTGNGNPDITTSASWITAWNLEYNGFANSTSSGGGRGGYSVGFTGPNPLVTGPNNQSWSSYGRSNTGGKGGRPLDYSTGRIFFGGGGGAPHEDDSHTQSGGGAAGGIIYLLSYGTISGSGNILSNGNVGDDANCGNGNGDPPGGGGSGGTIILNSTGAISGISIKANGGKGGDQIVNNFGESEGAAGGGGGGYISISNGSPSRQAAGGVNGTTNASTMVNFPPDGATEGADGLANETIAPLLFSSLVVDAGPDVTICSGRSVALFGTGGDSTVTTYSWTPSAGLSNTNTTHPVASPSVTTTYTLTATSSSCPGKDSMVVNVIPKVVINPLADTSLCPGKSALLNPGGSVSYSYTWSPSLGLNCNNCPNPSANPASSTTYTVIATNQFCSDTSQSIVIVLPLPTLTLNDTTICYGQLTTLNPVTNGTLTWSPADNLSCTACNNPQITPFSNQTYVITATLGNCIVTDSMKILVDQLFISAGLDTTIFNGGSVTLQASSAQQYIWSPSNSLSSSTISNPVASPSVTTTYFVTGYDALGCSASSEVVVHVNDPCQLPAVPNAFSPNGDGKNDIFKMLNPYADKLIVFSIYNRWGQLVFQTTELNQGWNGEFNNMPEPVGSYVYYIKIICQGETVAYKGNITLIR